MDRSRRLLRRLASNHRGSNMPLVPSKTSSGTNNTTSVGSRRDMGKKAKKKGTKRKVKNRKKVRRKASYGGK